MRLGEDGLEILDGKRLQLDPDRETALQFGNQIAGLAEMECAGGHEENVIGADHAVLRGHRRAFHQRQEVALHALSRDFGRSPLAARGDLVNLVNEDDAVLLGIVEGPAADLVLIEQLARLLIRQQLHGLGNPEPTLAPLGLTGLAEKPAQLLGHLFHARRPHDFERRPRLGQIDFDLLVVELPLAQFLAKGLPGRALGR